jgi:hypothetical protein
MEIECETCGRDDVELTEVRKRIYYCRRHLPLFTQHWEVDPTRDAPELEQTSVGGSWPDHSLNRESTQDS